MIESRATLDQRYAPLAIVTTRPVGDEMVALNLTSGIYYSFNELGTFIWKHVERRRTLAEIVRHVLDDYEVSAEAATQDVTTFLQQLVDWRLVAAE